MSFSEIVFRLSRYNDLKIEINDLLSRLQELKSFREGISAHRVRHSPSSNQIIDHVAEIATDIAEIENLLDERRSLCVKELYNLHSFIESFADSRARTILRARYVDSLSWKRIAWMIEACDEQVPRRFHNRLLQNLSDTQIQILNEGTQTASNDAVFCMQ